MQPPYHKRELGPKQIYKFSPTTDQLASDWTAASGNFTPPLWLLKVDAGHVIVVFGQVNGITPTSVATNITVSGTNGTWSIYLDATINAAGTPTAVAVSAGTAGVPANTSTHAYRLIGEADVAAGVITAVRPNLAWAQEFVACGRDPADPATTPGTYHWQVA